jgi:hypothetical protein
MDLNYLLYRQQVERSRARAATTDAARTAHEEMARGYEAQIDALSGNAFSVDAVIGAARPRGAGMPPIAARGRPRR